MSGQSVHLTTHFLGKLDLSPCHTKPCLHCAGTGLFNFPEIARKFVKYFSWKGASHGVLTSYSDHGFATELAWRSISFLPSSCWRLSVLSWGFQATHKVTMHALSFHSLCSTLTGVLKTQWHLKECCTIVVQTPWKTTAFARPLCAPSYCVEGEITAWLWQPHCALIRTQSHGPCLSILCDSTASTVSAIQRFS